MAEFLTWLEEWNMHIPVLDHQHRAIGAQLNTIVDMLERSSELKKPGHELEDGLRTLLMLSREHFKTEEVQMRVLDYPGYVEHKKEHVMLQAELTQYIREIVKNNKLPDMDTLKALKFWFVSHLISDDKVFATYYHQKQSEYISMPTKITERSKKPFQTVPGKLLK